MPYRPTSEQVKAKADRFARVYDALAEEPMYFNEIRRKLDLDIRQCRGVIKRLTEEDYLVKEILDKNLFRFEGIIRWKKYDLYSRKKTPKFAGTPKSAIDRKKAVIRGVSKLGLSSALTMEDCLYRAALRVYDYWYYYNDKREENITLSPFNSTAPDLLVKDPPLCLEISSRFENAVDFEYCKQKLKECVKVNPDARLVILAPLFTDKAVSYVIHNKILFREISNSLFPVFAKDRSLAVNLDRVARKYRIVYFWDIVDELEKYLWGTKTK